MDMNAMVIAEFRAGDGRVGGGFEGAPLVLVHNRGARSGTERVTPLVHIVDQGRYIVMASANGASENPAWFHNLRANPRTSIEVPAADGTTTVPVTAELVKGKERDRLWARIVEALPQMAGYQQRTSRLIPVFALTPTT